jgi:hypothetical protein
LQTSLELLGQNPFVRSAAGDVTYTDSLGRVVVVHPTTNGATVTINGYVVNGISEAPNRVITINTAMIGATTAGVPVNLRSDFRSLQRPFISGDYSTTESANNGDEGSGLTYLTFGRESRSHVTSRLEEGVMSRALHQERHSSGKTNLGPARASSVDQ